MPRPCRRRRVCAEPDVRAFGPMPGGEHAADPVVLLVEEYEAIRVIDHEKRTHEQCAAQMLVSRTTVTEIYERARAKVAEALIKARPLRIEGGRYEVCNGRHAAECAGRCRWKFAVLAQALIEGDNTMKIAIPVKNDIIYQHFGMASQFRTYDVKDGRVVATGLIEATGQGHGRKVQPLVENGVECVICGGIGEGATAGLASAGIRLIAGIQGNADEAVEACIAETLVSNPEAAAAMSRHRQRHQDGNKGGCGCGGHGHGEGGCGCGGHGHGEGECGCGGHGEGGCGCGGHGRGEGECGCGGHGHGEGGCGCGRRRHDGDAVSGDKSNVVNEVVEAMRGCECGGRGHGHGHGGCGCGRHG